MKIEFVSDVACPWCAVGLHALLRAYHGQGRNPSASEVLLKPVAEVGLDVERARAILAGEEFAAEVRAEQILWLKSGVDSVPAVVVNRRQLIQDAQTPEAFEQALRRIAMQAL